MTDSLNLTGRVSLSTEGVDTSFKRVGDGAEKMSRQVSDSAKKSGDAVKGIGDGADGSAQKFTRAGASIRNEIERSTKSLKEFGLTASQKLELKIQTKGLDASQFAPYLSELKRVEKAQADAAKSATDMQSAYEKGVAIGDKIKTTLAGVAVASVAAGAAFYAVFDKFTKMAGEFQSMAEKTGDSAQNIASLAVTAGEAGFEMSAVVGISQKLTNGLTGVDDESKKAGAAIKALGLDLADFKKMAPADQIEQVGKALNGFQDGAEKTAVAIALFGKAGADALPFLIKIGAEGARQNILTSEQIALADEYSNKQAKLLAELSLQAQALATSLIPTYNALSEVIKETALEMIGLDSAASSSQINEKLVSTVQDAAVVFANLADVAYTVGASFAFVGNNLGAMAAITASLAQGDLQGARAIGAASDEFNAKLKFTLGLADKVEKKFADINAQAAKSRAIFDDPRRLGNVGSIAEQTLANNGKKLVFNGVTGGSAAVAAAASEYDKLIKKLGVELPKAIAESEAAQMGYNKAQSEFIALANSPAWAKFTEKQKMNVASIYEGIIANEQAKDAQVKLDKAILDAAQSREKYLVSLDAGLDKIKADTQAQIEATKRLGLSKEAIAKLDAAKLEMLATDLELQAIKKLDKNLDEEAYNALKAQAAAYRDLAAAKQGFAQAEGVQESAKQVASEWKKTADDIEKALTDSLMRGFESGKDMVSSLRDYIVNAFKTMVVKVAVQPIMGAVTGLLGGASPAASAASSLGGGMLGNISSLAGAFGNSFGAGFSGTLSAGFSGIGASLSGGLSQIGLGTAKGLATGFGQIAGTLGPVALGITAVAALADAMKYTVEAKGGAYVAQASGMGTSSVALRSDFEQKGGLFGGGTTQNSAWADADAKIKAYFDESIAKTTASVKEYANALGLAPTLVDDFKKQIEVSITGLNLEQQQAAIDKALGGFFDSMVESAYGQSLKPLSKSGETTSATLVRLSASLMAVNQIFGMLGASALELNTTGAAVAAGLVDAFGSIEAAQQASAAYYDLYYNEAEKAANATQSITDQFAMLGVAVPESKDAFRALVESIDITTAAGQAMVATLIGIAPAFAAVSDAAEKTAADIAAKTADREVASRVERDTFGTSVTYNPGPDEAIKVDPAIAERASLQAQLNALTDTAAQALARQRDALQESNRELFDQIQLATKANAVAAERAGLQSELNALTDTAAQSLARQRDALDETNRALFDQIQIATAVKAATEAAAEAVAAANEAAVQALQAAAEASAATIKGFADDLKSLNVQLLQAQGNTSGAKAAQREIDIAGLSGAAVAMYDYNQTIRAQIDALNIAKAAAEKLASVNKQYQDQLDVLTGAETQRTIAIRDAEDESTKAIIRQIQAQEDLKIALDKAAAAAEATAARFKSALEGLATQKASLQVQLLQVQGNTVGAGKLQRETDLAALIGTGLSAEQKAELTAKYDANAAIEKQIEQEQKAQAAAAAAAQAAAQAARAAASAAKELKAAWQSVTDSIFEEVRRIRGMVDGNGESNFANAQANFAITAAQASAGDQNAAKMLPELSRALLELGATNASSLLQLQVLQGQTAGTLDAIAKQFAKQFGLTLPKFAVGTNYVPQDMAAIVHKGEAIIPAAYNPANNGGSNNGGEMVSELRALRAEIAELRTINAKTAEASKVTADLLKRVTRGGESMQTTVFV